MTYVLDSNVALKWALVEADSSVATRLRTEFKSQEHELIAPDIFSAEIAHAIARAERRQIVSHGQGVVLLMHILATPPQMHPYIPLLRRAFDIASQARIGVDDCLYVVLAERESCELVTADDRLVRVLQPTYPFITPLASLP